MNVLISGATGYLGSNVINYLALKGHKISTVDRSYNIDIQQKAYDIFLYFSNPNEIDFTNNSKIATSKMMEHFENIKSLMSINNINMIIYASSIRIYDKSPGAYSIAHQSIESLLLQYSSSNGISLSRLRFSNVFGGSIDSILKRDTLVPHVFIKEALVYGRIKMETDGLQHRDFIPISLVNKYIDYVCINKPKTIDVCSGINLQIREVAYMVERLFSGVGVEVGKHHGSHHSVKYFANIRLNKGQIQDEIELVVNQWREFLSDTDSR